MIKLLASFPDKPWNWEEVSRNPNITIRDVIDHPKLKWKMEGLAENPAITFEDLWTYGKVALDNFCFFNPNLNLQDVLNLHLLPGKSWLKDEWDWNGISYNPAITIKDVIENPDLPWNVYCLFRNPSITPADIFKHPEIFGPANGEKCQVNARPCRKQSLELKLLIHRNTAKYNALHKYTFVTINDILKNPFGMEEILIGANLKPYMELKDWDWEFLSSCQFGWTEKKYKYSRFVELSLALKVLTNNSIPKYLLMEILEDETTMTLFQMYHTL